MTFKVNIMREKLIFPIMPVNKLYYNSYYYYYSLNFC